jgi:hypothetical protein
LILSFSYITSGLPLVGGADLLAEKLADETEEDAEALFGAAQDILDNDPDADLTTVLEKARLAVEEEREKERVRLEIEARKAAQQEARRRKNREERFRYEVTEYDPLCAQLLNTTPMAMSITGEPCTDAQATLIEKMTKGKVKTDGLTKKAAMGIIGQLMKDREAGKASYAQRDLMCRKLGVTPEAARNMTFQQASDYISANKRW